MNEDSDEADASTPSAVGVVLVSVLRLHDIATNQVNDNPSVYSDLHLTKEQFSIQPRDILWLIADSKSDVNDVLRAIAASRHGVPPASGTGAPATGTISTPGMGNPLLQSGIHTLTTEEGVNVMYADREGVKVKEAETKKFKKFKKKKPSIRVQTIPEGKEIGGEEEKKGQSEGDKTASGEPGSQKSPTSPTTRAWDLLRRHMAAEGRKIKAKKAKKIKKHKKRGIGASSDPDAGVWDVGVDSSSEDEAAQVAKFRDSSGQVEGLRRAVETIEVESAKNKVSLESITRVIGSLLALQSGKTLTRGPSRAGLFRRHSITDLLREDEENPYPDGWLPLDADVPEYVTGHVVVCVGSWLEELPMLLRPLVRVLAHRNRLQRQRMERAERAKAARHKRTSTVPHASSTNSVSSGRRNTRSTGAIDTTPLESHSESKNDGEEEEVQRIDDENFDAAQDPFAEENGNDKNYQRLLSDLSDHNGKKGPSSVSTGRSTTSKYNWFPPVVVISRHDGDIPKWWLRLRREMKNKLWHVTVS